MIIPNKDKDLVAVELLNEQEEDKLEQLFYPNYIYVKNKKTEEIHIVEKEFLIHLTKDCYLIPETSIIAKIEIETPQSKEVEELEKPKYRVS
jgi:hypothetical protein